jgi:hypothetical protein
MTIAAGLGEAVGVGLGDVLLAESDTGPAATHPVSRTITALATINPVSRAGLMF